MDFGRLVTAMVTPFTEELQIDWDQTARLIDWLIDRQQTDSIVVNGTTGESPALSDSEREELFRFAVKHANGRCKIIAGTGSFDTSDAIQQSKVAESAGVDGLLQVAPYYNRPSQEGIYQHFKAIAEAVRLPIMLYNIPSRTGINISAETTARLARIPNIVATKESSGDLDQMTEILTLAPNGFKLYSGDDSMTLPVLAVGGYGIVSVAAHVVGAQIKQMVVSFSEGNSTEAARLHQTLYPVFKGLFNCPHRVPNPVPVKYALGVCGMPVGGVRLPLVGTTEQEAQFIRDLMGKFDLIPASNA